MIWFSNCLDDVCAANPRSLASKRLTGGTSSPRLLSKLLTSTTESMGENQLVVGWPCCMTHAAVPFCSVPAVAVPNSQTMSRLVCGGGNVCICESHAVTSWLSCSSQPIVKDSLYDGYSSPALAADTVVVPVLHASAA